MSHLLQTHIDLLSTINRSSVNKAEGIIKHSSNIVVKLYSELALNVLKGIVPITTKEKNKLMVVKSVLKTLSTRKISLKKKKELLSSNIVLLKLLSKIVIRYFSG
jgi:hypothetical protein